MPSIERLDQSFPWDSSPLQKELRRLMGVLEPRFRGLENQVINWEAAVESITSVGLKRINESLGSLVESMTLALDAGFLVIEAVEQPQTLVVEESIGIQATSAGFQLFQPTPYLLIVDNDDHTNWGMLRLDQYLKDTGELAATVVFSEKEQVGSNWTISCNSAVWQAMRDLLDAAVAAKEIAEAAVATTAAQVETVEGLLEVIQGGPVVSVAGKSGAVVIELADVVGLVSALAGKASASSLSGKQDASAKLTAISDATWAADYLLYLAGPATVAPTPLTAFMRTLLDDVDQATAKATLGVPSAASDAAIRSANGSGYIQASSLSSASALVTLTDAATVVFDWSSGINFQVTIGGNRTLGNPSNGIPGTTRTVLLKGNDATDRTISFASNYKGDLPDITDIDSGRWYLLTIFCITATHFVVTSHKAYGS